MQIIGHRGAKDLAPENTIAGIKFALRRQVDWVEFDVHCTKDNRVVVIHDSIQRFIKRGRLVRECTYGELKQYAISAGQSIPTLSDVMRTIGEKAKVMIEIKEIGCVPQVVEEVGKHIASGRTYDDFLINSSSIKTLRAVQKLNRKIHLTYLHHYAHAVAPLRFLTIRGLKLYAVGFWSFVAPKFAIQAAKKRGLWTIVYTINDKPLAQKFERRGVDAIITDRPQEFLSLWPMIVRWVLATVLIVLLGYVVWLRPR